MMAHPCENCGTCAHATHTTTNRFHCWQRQDTVLDSESCPLYMRHPSRFDWAVEEYEAPLCINTGKHLVHGVLDARHAETMRGGIHA